MADEIDITETIRGMVEKHNQELEGWLLKFFGSYENAKDLAHLYVLEERQISHGMDFASDSYIFSTEYRLRHKTPEELERDAHADEEG